jgi:hypothetical protein
MTTYDRTTVAIGSSGDKAVTAPVLAVVWCRSVGSFWTLELHHLQPGKSHPTPVDWINSGVPITQPQPPEQLARELLAQRRLWLFCDPSTGPRTSTRHGIGYAAGNADLITLARLVANEATETDRHPVMLAAQWVAAGFSAEAAMRRIRQGIHSPSRTPKHTPTRQPTTSPPHTTSSAPALIPTEKPAKAAERNPASAQHQIR